MTYMINNAISQYFRVNKSKGYEPVYKNNIKEPVFLDNIVKQERPEIFDSAPLELKGLEEKAEQLAEEMTKGDYANWLNQKGFKVPEKIHGKIGNLGEKAVAAMLKTKDGKSYLVLDTNYNQKVRELEKTHGLKSGEGHKYVLDHELGHSAGIYQEAANEHVLSLYLKDSWQKLKGKASAVKGSLERLYATAIERRNAQAGQLAYGFAQYK